MGDAECQLAKFSPGKEAIAEFLFRAELQASRQKTFEKFNHICHNALEEINITFKKASEEADVDAERQLSAFLQDIESAEKNLLVECLAEIKVADEKRARRHGRSREKDAQANSRSEIKRARKSVER